MEIGRIWKNFFDSYRFLGSPGFLDYAYISCNLIPIMTRCFPSVISLCYFILSVIYAVILSKAGVTALGRVKFIFPNTYNMYFHDTPAKSRFNESSRAFSHGCIRVDEPAKLAEYLLRDQPEWTTEKIKEGINESKENWVTLKKPVPLFISILLPGSIVMVCEILEMIVMGMIKK